MFRVNTNNTEYKVVINISLLLEKKLDLLLYSIIPKKIREKVKLNKVIVILDPPIIKTIKKHGRQKRRLLFIIFPIIFLFVS